MVSEYCSEEAWSILSPIEFSIKKKIEAMGTPLNQWNAKIYRGILTGLNEAFIISDDTRKRIISEDPKSAEIIRPILRGRDIKRYSYEYSDLYLISTFPSKKYNIDEYPAVRDFLLSFGIKRLEQTGKKYTINGEEIKARKKTNNKWFETQDSISYWDDFDRQKIMYNDITQRLSFALVPENMLCVNTVYFIKDNPHIIYLLAALNSKIIDWYYRTLSVQLGEKAVRMFSIYVLDIPIPEPDATVERDIEQRVQNILDGNEADIAESEIERLLSNMYGFTEEEFNFLMEYNA